MTELLIPDGPIRLSNSKVNTWRRCPNQYRYKYGMKLRKKVHGLPLKRGDWLHQLLMTHYDGHDWRERQALLAADFNQMFEEEREEYGDLPAETQRIMASYLAHYQHEDRNWRTVDTEVDELVELPNGDKFNFIVDCIMEDSDGALWIWDHKTVGRFMPEDFMLIDAQLARYFWAAKQIGYKNLRGAMFNEIITKPPTLPKFLEPSQRLEMRKNIHCDAYTYMREIKRHKQDPKQYRDFLLFLKARHKEWFRRTRLPRDRPMVQQLMRELMQSSAEMHNAHATNRYPRTARKECLFDCDYMEICALELQGGDIEDIVKMRYTTSKRENQDETAGWVGKGK